MEDLLKKVLDKLDIIERDMRGLYEAMAKNEAEHDNYERRLVELAEKKTVGVQALAWISSIVALMLSITTLMSKF